MSNEVDTLDSLLKSLHVNVSRIWLESCIGWCKEETLPPSYTLKQLQNSVLEQWLLLDLRDLEIPCLPPNIAQKKKFILNGTFSLQLMYVTDVSKPKHWQLQRIRNGIPKNLDQEAENSKRMLMLCLTDGVQEVFASEYQPIPCLNINVRPGLKMKLKGPIDVRQGRLMLKAENVKLLGGEVDSLIIPNAAENILAERLNLPFNPKPNVISESILAANESVNSSVVHSSYANVDRSLATIPQNVNRAVNVHQVSNMQDDAVGDLISEDDMQLLMEMPDDFDDYVPQSKKVQSESSVTQRVCKTPDMFEDMEFDVDLANIEVPPVEIKLPEKKQENNGSQGANVKTIDHKTNEISMRTNEEAKSDRVDDSSIRRIEDEYFVSPPIKTNICSIGKLSSSLPNISKGKFKIKGKFVTVVEKMTVNDEGYQMVIKVTDDSGDISLKVSDAVMAGVIGYTAKEFMGFKEAILKESAEAESQVLEALKRLKLWLTKLDNILEVQVDKEQKVPFVIKVL
ncbi:unnamed protein product [Acanthoscelides obtectus]|uniref:RecQ-mediated genome instability protein 1 n=1 Tax=Acanthoscelides obtectus TaxID=200917 RepID=A0A9P0PHG2_ACAOB|nr:unnamed protein product [Acanthoscelides obtectus]CAK1676840.1 RecQ-mediated genome instability protein 1 [Acanthoscelides obtectus]